MGTWSSDTPPGGPFTLTVGDRVTGLNFVPASYGASPSPDDDYDYFTFLAIPGTAYRVMTRAERGDTIVVLYDPSDHPLAIDIGKDGLAVVERTLGGGWHKLLVRGICAWPPTTQIYDISVSVVQSTYLPLMLKNPNSLYGD
jgi:hypothetical protein